MATWIVTRAEEDCPPLLAALTRAGVDCRAVPCLRRTEIPWPPWPAHEAGVVDLCLVTSQMTANHLVAHRPPPDVQLAAIAPHTSKLLRNAGLGTAVETEGGVESLAEAIARWHQPSRGRLRIRYPTSDAGLDSPEQLAALERLEALGAVERFSAYLVTAPRDLAEHVAAVGPGAGWLFFSPSAVEHYCAAVPPKPGAILCHGESTLRAYTSRRNPGWPEAVLRDRSKPVETCVLELEKSAP